MTVLEPVWSLGHEMPDGSSHGLSDQSQLFYPLTFL